MSDRAAVEMCNGAIEHTVPAAHRMGVQVVEVGDGNTDATTRGPHQLRAHRT